MEFFGSRHDINGVEGGGGRRLESGNCKKKKKTSFAKTRTKEIATTV